MFETTIHGRVMKAVKARIEVGQKAYNDFCIREDKKLKENIRQAKMDCGTAKEKKATEIVESIFNR